MRQLIGCFSGHVIETSKSLDVAWGSYTMLMAELQCMKDLLRTSTDWLYYINLTGEEFPLVTNLELVAVLKQLSGVNIIEGGQWPYPTKVAMNPGT